MALDEYVSLGRSGLRVSPLALGGMTFGEDHGWGASPAESEAMLAEYLDRGGNFVDTANIYTNGHSEKIIGDFFARRPAQRDRVVIGTKFFANLFAGDPNGGGAGRKAMTHSLEASLRRLRTDHVDVYWLHNWDPGTPVEETLRALDDLVAAGKVRYVGFSDLPAWKVAEAQVIARFRGWTPVIGLQLEYSLLERTSEGELIPMAREHGIGVLPWGPLKGGLLTGKYDRTSDAGGRRSGLEGAPTEHDHAVVDAVRAVAAETGTSPAAVALAWVRSQPGVTSTLVGARRVEQLRDNLASLDVELTAGQLAALDAVSAPSLGFPANHRDLGPSLAFAGATVDGVRTRVLPLLTASATRY